MPPRRRQLRSLAVIVTLSLGLLLAGPAAGSALTGPDDGVDRASVDSADGQSSPAPDVQTQSTPETDTTTTRIAVRENGSAEWQLTIRMALETDSDVEEFSAFQEEFERNRSQYVGQFREQMTSVVGNAETATNRDMTATAFAGETGVQEAPRRWGYVTYRFRWDGFAQTGDGTITVGDVFRGGYFLEEDDILIVETPAGYEVESTDPNPDRQRSDELQWNGPASFANERPEVALTDGSAAADDSSGAPADSSAPAVFAVVGVLVVLVVSGVAYGRYRRPGSGGDTSDDRSSGGVTAPADRPGTPEAEPAGRDELATDEDQVLSLLEAEGGRIRQAEIADRLDWSDSKTSRVLSEMADEGAVEKLRIGRENVIDLATDDE